MPRVSVVIPNYNHAGYLEKRIRSVLDQTYRDFEVIFLDDASTDDSREVFAKFADDPRIRSVFNETNSGSTFRQWNRGFREAAGEYVWLAESDDYAHPQFLEATVRLLDGSPTAGLAYCASMCVDENGNELFVSNPACWITGGVPRFSSTFVNNGRSECAEYLVVCNTVPNASAVLLRKSVVEAVGPADESLRIAGDWQMWARMMLASDVAYTGRVLNFWRMHQNTVRKNTERSGLVMVESYRTAAFIASQSHPCPEALDTSCNFWAKRWAESDKLNHFGLGQNRRILCAAMRLHPSLMVHIRPFLRHRLTLWHGETLNRIWYVKHGFMRVYHKFRHYGWRVYHKLKWHALRCLRIPGALGRRRGR